MTAVLHGFCVTDFQQQLKVDVPKEVLVKVYYKT